ncbi:hypothetical protein GECvBMG_gp202 [Salmonella phage GEC_vB_MG]|nr:hypothetical protein GECvBMG_gp202 [Salmonella phage GEC_vB_MG]
MLNHVCDYIVASTSHDNANENDKYYHLSYPRVIVSLATLAPLTTITRTIFFIDKILFLCSKKTVHTMA